MPTEVKKTNVYALFIGIDAYEGRVFLENNMYFPELGGCVADVTEVEKALKADKSLSLKSEMLLDKKATKKGIINAIDTHLGQAQKDDAILIYYSGHGTVEHADKSVWTSETDGRLEGIVCYYDQPNTGKFILVDKEWRYLLHQLWTKTQAHIVTIFDCCNSGDNTRSTNKRLDPKGNADVRVRKVDYTFKQRAWEDFIFANTLKPDDFKNTSLETVLPSGQYVQFSASESNEPAEEVNGHGVFTRALLEVLKDSGGYVSYNEINSRIRNKISFAYDQRPRIYAPSDAVDLKKQGFLKKPITEGLSQAALTYNTLLKAYRINKGIIHGVKAGKTTVSIKVGNKTLQGSITNTLLDVADVQFSSADKTFLKGKDYMVELQGLDNRTVGMRLVDRQKNTDFVPQLAEKLSSEACAPYVKLTEEEIEIEYDIVVWRGKVFITRPNDWVRPLLPPLSISDAKSLDTVLRDVTHLSRWQFFYDFENTAENVLSNKVLKVEMFTIDGGVDNKLESSANIEVNLQFDPNKKNNKWRRYLKFNITNQSNKDIYVSAILIGNDATIGDYCVDPHLLQPDGVKHLEPKESFQFEDKTKTNPNEFLFTIDKNSYWYNWEKEDFRIKIIYSEQQFQNDDVKLMSLDGPPYPDKKSKGIQKGPANKDEEDIDRPKWSVVDFDFHIKNPEYNKVKPEDIELMLKDKAFADFAEALYIEVDTNGKGSLTINQGEDEKRGFGFNTVLSAANVWASSRRNAHYKKMCKKYPDRPRLVSEGDSWFQHPMLNDIIDNIGVYLPVRCLAAAGDTIANYVKMAEFSEAIAKEKPFAFLLSGGGNDILGDNLRKFLVKSDVDAPEGTEVERFFSPNFPKAIDDIINLYRLVFDILKIQNPQLHILTHGYDYIRPLPPNSSPKSWLGKYFDEIGLLRLGDRWGALKYMMNSFNEALSALIKEYPNVHFIDLRGIVGDDEWSDEIHPNDTGYQKVSMKFMNKLTELIQPLVS
jgi:lysophospholipase L1-like esterase